MRTLTTQRKAGFVLLSTGAATAALIPAAQRAAQSQPRNNSKTVTASAVAAPAPAKAGTTGVLAITLSIKPGFHIYSNAPGSADFIPTEVKGEKTAGVSWGKIQYPAAKSVTMAAISPSPVMVYETKAVVRLPYTLAKTIKPGKVALKAAVTCQACSDTICYPPQTLPVSVDVIVR